MTTAEFNAEQWARDHDDRDIERFATLTQNVSNVWKVLGAAGLILVGMLGWSLQAQYTNAQKQLDAIQQVQLQLAKAPHLDGGVVQR